MIRRNPGTSARATSTTPIAPLDSTASRQVSWRQVHRFVQPVLAQVHDWPMLGTPAWCNLSHEDSRKWCALLDGAQHWALRVEGGQEARADASHAASGAADWGAVGWEIQRRREVYMPRAVFR
jgi:hypothetical protein